MTSTRPDPRRHLRDLILLPLEQLVQIGATVAVGPAQHLRRSCPAITNICGDRAWWPGASRLTGLLQSDDQRKEVVLISSHMLQGTLEVQGR